MNKNKWLVFLLSHSFIPLWPILSEDTSLHVKPQVKVILKDTQRYFELKDLISSPQFQKAWTPWQFTQPSSTQVPYWNTCHVAIQPQMQMKEIVFFSCIFTPLCPNRKLQKDTTHLSSPLFHPNRFILPKGKELEELSWFSLTLFFCCYCWLSPNTHLLSYHFLFLTFLNSQTEEGI